LLTSGRNHGIGPERRKWQTRIPLNWLSEAYPFVVGTGKNARRLYEKEFILLHKKINSGPKNQVSPIKRFQHIGFPAHLPATQMFSDEVIYNDKDMDEGIKRTSTRKRKSKLVMGEWNKQPRTVLQRMRAVVGAYLYLKEPKVNDIFIKQVDRIGQQLENLENALAKQPRIAERKVKDPKPNEDNKKSVPFHVWKPQKLKEKWFAYVDDVYKKADKKAQDFMKTNIERMEKEYTDAKMIKQDKIDKEKKDDEKKKLILEKDLREEMKKAIPKLKAEWTKSKDWPKPSWNQAKTT
jgi:hypothetical protein